MDNLTNLVMTTAVVAAGSTEAARLAKKQAPTMKPIIGGFLLGLFLFALGMMSDRLTAMFCVLIIVGSLLINGVSLFALAK